MLIITKPQSELTEQDKLDLAVIDLLPAPVLKAYAEGYARGIKTEAEARALATERGVPPRLLACCFGFFPEVLTTEYECCALVLWRRSP